MSSPDALQTLLDKQAIHELVSRYARAVDRLDRALLTDCYWPDGTDDHGGFKGDAAGYVDWSISFLEAWQSSQHVLSNGVYEVEGDEAFGETYWTGFYTFFVDGVLRSQITTGRYLDHFQKRDGEWRIFHRTSVNDWMKGEPVAADWRDSPPRNLIVGQRGEADLSYRVRALGADLRKSMETA